MRNSYHNTTSLRLSTVLVSLLAFTVGDALAHADHAQPRIEQREGANTQVHMHELMHSMQSRMQTLQSTAKKPEWLRLMNAQMHDMEEMMTNLNYGCPMSGEQGARYGYGAGGPMHNTPRHMDGWEGDSDSNFGYGRARAILDARYAEGKIDQDEYLQRLEDLKR